MRKNPFLEKTWLNNHIREIRQKAGARYTPELNVELPITEIFDGISRTEAFYTSIREHFGNLSREFGRLSKKYDSKRIDNLYKKFTQKMESLLKVLSKVKEFDTSDIPWQRISKLSHEAVELSWKLSSRLRDEKEKLERKKTEDKKIEPSRSPSERLGSDIHYLYKIQKELRYFKELSQSPKAKLSNRPFLLLTGLAGTGKTHLLCDVVENHIKREIPLPSVITFGEFFTEGKSAQHQIVNQLGLRKKTNENNLLKLLNDAGRKASVRSLLVIDAVNESKSPIFWKRNLNTMIDKVIKYPHIALVISVRSGFEDEVFLKKHQRFFIHEEHRGFQFREWEAVTKFFKEFSLSLPEIPLLMPEFQNPLFLLLFCKAFQNRAKKNLKKDSKKQRQVFRGHEGATYIFENFVKSVADKIAGQFGLSKGRDKQGNYVIWDTVIEKVAAEMVEYNTDRISKEKLEEVVKNVYPSIDCESFINALEKNLLLEKVPRYALEESKVVGFDFRFPFQKFSDHLIARYIFKKYENEVGKTHKSLVSAKKFFSRRRRLGKFIAQSWNKGIIEALSIQCPEQLRGIEFFEVAPFMKGVNITNEAFLESLIWRKPNAFTHDLKNTLGYINGYIIKTKSEHDYLLNVFLSVAPVPEHPFNASFLHRHLSKFSMPKRDSWWSSKFLHYQYGEQNAVDRLVEWGWSEQDKSHISDESLKLCAIALAWFLTTPNRFLRDKTTKALIALLSERLNIVLELLKTFQQVNDPYVAERLYAVAYGCALRSRKDKKELEPLAMWIYKVVFLKNAPPTHILLRDYARGVIDMAIQRDLSLHINKRKINPPYNSKWPTRFPSNKTIEKFEFDYKAKDFKDYFWAQNSIIHSMQPEHSRIFMYGDFGRYTFQSALSHFSYPKSITMQKLSNWATKKVFDLGYDVELHGDFDRSLNRYQNYGRSEHKPERIGKKYQWIALHELLALVSDHFQTNDEATWSEKKTVPYEGPWQMSIRDIDPSCILKEFPNLNLNNLPTFKKHTKSFGYDAWNKRYSDTAWLKKITDLPNPKKVIEITDDKSNKWLTLEGFIEWQEKTPPEQEKYHAPTKRFWYIIKSYLVKKKDLEEVFSWCKKQNFMGRWMSESHDFYNVFLGEYPWAQAFLYQYIPYYMHDGWTDDTREKRIPAKVLVTDDSYISSGSSIDCSADETIRVKLPAKWIVDKMRLRQNFTDGRFFNKEGELEVFDPGVFKDNLPKVLLIRKRDLCKFLNSKGYAIFWTLLGEKNMIGGGSIGQPLGWLETNGAYTLNHRSDVIGSKKSTFKKPS